MNAIPRRSARLARKMASVLGTTPSLMQSSPAPAVASPAVPPHFPYSSDTQNAMTNVKKMLLTIDTCPITQKIEKVTDMLEFMLTDALTPVFKQSAHFRNVVKSKLIEFRKAVYNVNAVKTMNITHETAVRFSNAMTALNAHILKIEANL